MHAVLGVDLKPRSAGLLDHDLVHPRRAIPLRGFVELRQIVLDGDPRVVQLQVARLIFLMIRIGNEYRRQPVEGDHAVRTRVLDPRYLADLAQRLVVGLAVVQREWRSAQQHVVLHECQRSTQHGPEPVQSRTEVARPVEFFPDPGAFDALLKHRQVARPGLLIDLQRLEHRFRCQHPGLDRSMGALDLRTVQKARFAAHQQASGKAQARQRLEPALVHRPRPVGHALAALQHRAYAGMMLPALEFGEGVKMRVFVIQGDDESEKNLVVLGVIEKAPALGAIVQRPAERMHDRAGRVHFRVDIPDFLEADPVVLRVGPLP